MHFDFPKYGTNILMRIPFLYASLTNAVPVKKITNIPHPCWHGLPEKGNDIINKRFHWAGYNQQFVNSPWDALNAPCSWVESAHSFDWIYDTRLSTVPNAKQVVQEWTRVWIKLFETRSQPIWRSDIVAKRLTNWLVHFDHYFAYTDKKLKDKLLASITKHYKHLEFTEGKECNEVRRITSLRGLIIGAIALEQPTNIKRHILSICQILEDSLNRDGFNTSGHLPTQINYLKDSILIRSALHNAQMDVPEILNRLIEKMIPAIKFFMHNDGGITHMAGWSGNGNDIYQILKRTDAKSKTPTVLEDSGFYHIDAGKTSIIFDASNRTHKTTDNAGLLSLELSHAKQRIIVNCGYPSASDHALHDYARGTPAHSTPSLQSYNSISLDNKNRTAETVSSLSEAQGWQLLQGQHTGLKNISNTIITRAVFINKAGTQIIGQDSIERDILGRRKMAQVFENRFHLHPKIDAMLLANKKEIILRHNKMGWSFRTSGGEMSLKESYYIDKNDSMRKTQQIVITQTIIEKTTSIKWIMTTL